MDLGYLVEGTVEIHPATGRLGIRTEDEEGNVVYFDPDQALGSYVGKEVRFTCVSFEVLEHLTQLYEQSGKSQ